MARKKKLVDDHVKIIALVPTDLKERLTQRAEAQGLNLASWLRSHLIEHDKTVVSTKGTGTFATPEQAAKDIAKEVP